MTGETKALFFDVFGTVVDWRAAIIRELSQVGREVGVEGDWPAMSDAWRAAYYRGIAEVREGARDFTTIDVILRGALDALCPQFGLGSLGPEARDALSRTWQRLDPWPDAVSGLERLRRDRPVCALSNGNVALVVRLSRHAGLQWDMVFGPDFLAAYKPSEAAYLTAARTMRLPPEGCMMVATHARDIRAAKSFGLKTAYVRRPDELGPSVDKEKPDPDTDVVVDDLVALASALGAAAR